MKLKFIASFLIFFTIAAVAEIKLSPQWTERYLFKHYPHFLKNSHTDHVLAFYYFGSYQNYTVMGMERVQGDDYTPYYTVLIFKDSKLLGFYQHVPVFPSGINKKGELFFPANSGVTDKVTLATPAYPVVNFPEVEVGYQTVPPHS